MLGVHLDIYRFVWLHTNDEFVSGYVFENSGCDIAKLDSDLRLLFIQSYCLSALYIKGRRVFDTFSSLEYEWNTIPSLILNVQCHGSECWASRVFRDGLVIFVTLFAAINRLGILANDDILWFNW